MVLMAIGLVGCTFSGLLHHYRISRLEKARTSMARAMAYHQEALEKHQESLEKVAKLGAAMDAVLRSHQADLETMSTYIMGERPE
jgi:hypothetical protein